MGATQITAPTRRPVRSKAAIARHVKEQRRGYAGAVLAALARSMRGRPTAQIRRLVKDSLRPLGVQLSTARWQAMAKAIAAGQPVQLPE
jgi:hypothetical protein